MLTDEDKCILNAVQTDFPLTPHPYAVLAARLAMTEETLLTRLVALREAGYIRRIGAYFPSAALGYEGALIALDVEKDAVASVATAVNRYKGVTHNYEREGAYNLWFTLQTAQADERARILREIASLPGVRRLLTLPTEKTYKIRAQFHLA